MKRRMDVNRVDVTDFVIRDLYTVQNGRIKDPTYALSERAVNSVYGAVDLSWKDTVLPERDLPERLVFDPIAREQEHFLSVGFRSYVFSNSWEKPARMAVFCQSRFAYAQVGSDTDVPPYSDVLFYDITPNFFTGPDGSVQPVAGANTSTLPNRASSPCGPTKPKWDWTSVCSKAV